MDLLRLVNEGLPAVEKELNFSFARHTTIGSGGCAAVALYPSDILQAAACIAFLENNGVPYCFLGAGANVLPRDGAFEGAVIRFQRMKTLSFENELYADAGVTGGELLSFAERHSVTGFEPFAGIPTTVGGGVAMNAGIPERHFCDLVVRVVACKKGEIQTLSNEMCRFSQKSSVFLEEKIAVLGVYYKAEHLPQAEIRERTKHYLERRAHLPKGRSMGCTFVNPEGISAGALIDGCGLKGRRVGRAFISEEHANFIINEGACSEDIARLIDEVKNEVFRKTGILLREEVRRIP